MVSSIVLQEEILNNLFTEISLLLYRITIAQFLVLMRLFLFDANLTEPVKLHVLFYDRSLDIWP